MHDIHLQGIMGSVGSLISGGRSCKASDHRVRKGFQGKRGLLKHGVSQEPSANNNAKLSQLSGNSEDFFYIKVSHKPRGGEEAAEETAPRRAAPTELGLSARLEQTTEKSLIPAFPRSSSSSVETHNSLNTILGTRLSPVDRSKRGTPEPKHEMSKGSPSDSGISGSSYTSDGASNRNKWTNVVSGDRATPNSRSVSVLSDCINTEVVAKHLELRDRRSPFSDLHSISLDESVMDRRLHSCGSDVQLNNAEVLQAQQLLQLQVLQLQEDKDRLQEEVDQLIRDRDSAERSLTNQRTQITPTLEETQWEVCQKVGEISLLKQQLKESQADVVNKLNEIVSLKSALRDAWSKAEQLEEKNGEHEETLRLRSAEIEVCENELQRKKNEAELLRGKVEKLESEAKATKLELSAAEKEHSELQSVRARLQEQQHQLQSYQSRIADLEGAEDKTTVDILQKQVEKLRKELEEEKQKQENIQSSFTQEKQTWNKEKEKVIRYQKQLQYNYILMTRKNQDLEKTLKECNTNKCSRKDRRTDRTVQDKGLPKAELSYGEMVATDI